MKEDDVRINIVVSRRGVEKVQIFGGIKKQKKGMRLYAAISEQIESINSALKRGE